MGLDMWLMAEPKEPKYEEIFYWRKHNALHHWFEQRAIELGLVKNGEDFNCVSVYLTMDMLDKLEKDIIDGNLTPEEGFFFGPANYDPKEESETDLKAVNEARKVLMEGRKIWYTSWW